MRNFIFNSIHVMNSLAGEFFMQKESSTKIVKILISFPDAPERDCNFFYSASPMMIIQYFQYMFSLSSDFHHNQFDIIT